MFWEEITGTGGELSGRDLFGPMRVLSNSTGKKRVVNRENLRLAEGGRARGGNEDLGWWGNRVGEVGRW